MWSIKSPYSICSFLIAKKRWPRPPEKSRASTSQSQGASLKRKQGKRGYNKMPSGITYMTTLDLNGLPIEPPEARKSFICACRFLVRDNVSITIQDWWLMPESTKDQLWRNITEKIKYPDGVDEEFVKSTTFISMGWLFRRWKSDMNRKYVKTQLVPKHMGKITQA
jgi:hypothetical protein